MLVTLASTLTSTTVSVNAVAEADHRALHLRYSELVTTHEKDMQIYESKMSEYEKKAKEGVTPNPKPEKPAPIEMKNPGPYVNASATALINKANPLIRLVTMPDDVRDEITTTFTKLWNDQTLPHHRKMEKGEDYEEYLIECNMGRQLLWKGLPPTMKEGKL